ncbi:uncharacterized protein [Rutidosis leptorrhynchoides]|uniref:uncharacterized protein isoform X2 n=1 Tax=Rutidosis leptorrhynchoides TaxID=125765 RepID=UPI003A98E12F
MDKSKQNPTADELLRKILDLEARHAQIKQDISQIKISNNRPKPDHQSSKSASHYLRRAIGEPSNDGEVMEPLATKLTEMQYLNMVQSLGQAIHIFDLQHRIFFWSRAAEEVYGLTPDEVYGKTPTEILVDPKDAVFADYLLERTVRGETWSGEFPITNKRGERFVVICTNSPFRDENRRLIGGICISSDSRPYTIMKPGLSVSLPTRIESRQQPMKTSVVSKISNLASKMKLKMKIYHQGRSDDVTSIHSETAFEGESSTPRGHFGPSIYGVFTSITTKEHMVTRNFTSKSAHKSENKPAISKLLSPKSEAAWIGKKRTVWPWKGNEREVESLNAKLGYFGWQRLEANHEHELGPHISSGNINFGSNKMEPSGMSLSASRTKSTSSKNSNAIIKVEKEIDSMDYEIMWADLVTKEQIGQGSCGTVYHGLWYGSDVAVKLFTYQDYSDDVMISFKKEVSLMKRLRHPNILLFMGAVTSPQHLCIVSEFLPRGSLFRILQRNSNQLDWRRRLQFAMDIARGMNYLHRYNPPIVHRDLKSSNLLVDKNWTVKVGDFGLSHIKHHTYLHTKSGKGTPQWMAPEVLRNEQADEKCDVYSYGVVLWEIITGKIPWDDLNAMQVIAAVGFMNKRLEIPKDVDSMWVSLIESCWCSKPQSRPTFQEILYKLKDLHRKYAVERRR